MSIQQAVTPAGLRAMLPLSRQCHGSLVDCAGAQYISQVPLQHSKKWEQSHGCSAHQVKTQRKTKVAMSLVAMAGHLNKGKQDRPMPTEPAPCGLKSLTLWKKPNYSDHFCRPDSYLVGISRLDCWSQKQLPNTLKNDLEGSTGP